MIDLKIIPQKPAVIEGYDNELHALVKINQEETSNNLETNGVPLNFAIVIDKSGSMAGRPLEEAKRSAAYIIDKMRDQDRVAIVAYDDRVDVILPSQKVTDKIRIKAALEHIRSGGATDLHNGWLTGAEEVARNKSPNSLNRVLLLSDGHANRGEVSPINLQNQCGQLAEEGIITSTYGLGFSFNEELMISMARSGLGQSYYGETADDLLDPFQEEFDLLINTLAWNIRLTAETPSFVKLELLNKSKAISGQSNAWHLPDLAEGGDVWALFKLKIKDQNDISQKIEVLRCNITYECKIDDQIKKQSAGPVKLIIDRVSPAAFNAISEDEEVKRRIDELLFASLQERARMAALEGNWQRVNEILNESRRIAGSNEWLNESLSELTKYAFRRQTDHFSKEAMYSSEKMRQRLSSNDELASYSYSPSQEFDKKAYLRRKIARGKRMG